MKSTFHLGEFARSTHDIWPLTLHEDSHWPSRLSSVPTSSTHRSALLWRGTKQPLPTNNWKLQTTVKQQTGSNFGTLYSSQEIYFFFDMFSGSHHAFRSLSRFHHHFASSRALGSTARVHVFPPFARLHLRLCYWSSSRAGPSATTRWASAFKAAHRDLEKAPRQAGHPAIAFHLQ
jgi:hypothetical protein